MRWNCALGRFRRPAPPWKDLGWQAGALHYDTISCGRCQLAFYINGPLFFCPGFFAPGLDSSGGRPSAPGIDWSAPRRALRPAPASDSGPGGGGGPPGLRAGERSVLMSQFYWNEPSKGYSMSAEEFTAGTCQRPGPQPCPPSQPGCGCNPAPSPMPPTGCDCGGAIPGCPDGGCGQGPDYCQQMICCCRPAPGPNPQPPQVEEGCCCKQSFRAALSLLCDERISTLLDFDTAAFLTGTYTAGSIPLGAAPGMPQPRRKPAQAIPAPRAGPPRPSPAPAAGPTTWELCRAASAASLRAAATCWTSTPSSTPPSGKAAPLPPPR